MDRLDRLESATIHLLREAVHAVPSPAALWSMGKDSTALLHMARKAFLGRLPFPVLHVDTGFKMPEMIEFRDRIAAQWGFRLLVSRNGAALAERRTFPDGAVDRLECCALLKTKALLDAAAGSAPLLELDARTGAFRPARRRGPFRGLLVGIRADEEGSRSKERFFSLRDRQGRWKPGAQPPEFWGHCPSKVPVGTTLRVHPLLDWRESDVWEYTAREGIPTVPLYYDRGDGRRYRSLGCGPCTLPVASTAKNPGEVAAELTSGALRGVAERAGRGQDTLDRGTLETLRRSGYM